MSVCNAILFPDMCRLHTSTVGKLEGSTFTFYNQHGMHRRPGLRGQHTAHSIFTTSTAGAVLLACRASTERPAFLQPAQHAPSSWPLGRPAGSALPFYRQNGTRRPPGLWVGQQAARCRSTTRTARGVLWCLDAAARQRTPPREHSGTHVFEKTRVFSAPGRRRAECTLEGSTVRPFFAERFAPRAAGGARKKWIFLPS